MLRIPRVRSARALAAVAGGAALVVMTAGVTLAATSTGYQACANAGGRLALENSHGSCPSKFSKVTLGAKGPRGPKGPSGVVSMTQYHPTGGSLVTGVWAFLGSARPPVQVFAGTKTAAEVTATVDQASSDGGRISGLIGVCYEGIGGTTVTNVSDVQPQFAATPGSFFAQTVSGVVGNLPAGKYYVGLCAEGQADLVNGLAQVTIMLAQTSSGVTYAGPAAHPSGRAQG